MDRLSSPTWSLLLVNVKPLLWAGLSRDAPASEKRYGICRLLFPGMNPNCWLCQSYGPWHLPIQPLCVALRACKLELFDISWQDRIEELQSSMKKVMEDKQQLDTQNSALAHELQASQSNSLLSIAWLACFLQWIHQIQAPFEDSKLQVTCFHALV